MSRKLSEKYTEKEKSGALIGFLVRSDGDKVSTAKYNRVAEKVGLDRLKRADMAERLEQLDYDSSAKTPTTFYKTYLAVRNGKLTMHDVFGTTDNLKEFNTYLDSLLPTGVVANERLRLDRRENKVIQKQGIMAEMLVEDMLDQLSKDWKANKSVLKVPKVQVKHKDKALLINAADWHLGSMFKASAPGIENHYDLETFTKRWYEFLDYNIDLAKHNGIQNVYLIHLGDIVEGSYMRPNQTFNIELSFSEQVVRAMEEMHTTLERLVKAGLKVNVGMLIGNHDRIFNKKDNIYGDGVTRVVMAYLKRLIEDKQLQNVTLIDNTTDNHDIDVDIAGHRCFFTHGEKIKRNAAPDLSGLVGKGRPFDCVFYGHYHDFKVVSGNDGTLVVGCPANLGWNDYSKSLAMNNSAAGQLSVIMEKGRTPQIFPYFFSGAIKNVG